MEKFKYKFDDYKIKELIYMFDHFKEVFCYILFDISTQFLYHKVMYFSEKLSGRGVIIKSAENLGDFVPFFPQSALYVCTVLSFPLVYNVLYIQISSIKDNCPEGMRNKVPALAEKWAEAGEIYLENVRGEIGGNQRNRKAYSR